MLMRQRAVNLFQLYYMRQLLSPKNSPQDIFIVLQKDISGEDATGRVDYAIKSLEDLLCITEGKPRNIKIGYAQVRVLVFSVYWLRNKKTKKWCIISLRI